MKRTTYLFVACGLLLALTFSGCSFLESEPETTDPETEQVEDALIDDAEETEAADESEEEAEEEAETESAEEPVVAEPEEEASEPEAEESDARRRPEAPTEEATPPPAATEAPAEEPPAQETPATTFKDGSYSASGSYSSPAGPESVSVNLTIANDKVTAVSVSGSSENNISQSMIDKFKAGISSVVVGKSLEDLSVGVVNSSSLTGTGFNAAVRTIQGQARN